ncbi:MAG TPA: glycosyltransferase family 39 protein, partial [Ignavibacteriaceae bacterium]|nr:glycosyltransferase family 39 protein [Ignavibacteriaceae bacterium]
MLHKISLLYKNHQHRINISILILLTVSVFYNHLGNYYLAADDFSNLLHSEKNFFGSFVTNTYGQKSGGDYRPIEVLSHQMDRLLYGDDNVTGRHITNLIFHILNVIQVYLLASVLTRKKTIAFLAALIFAIHLIHGTSHSQPVTWISGRVEVFLVFFYLLSILLFLRFFREGSKASYLFSLTAFSLALLSKEMAATLPIIIFLFLILSKDKQDDDRILYPLFWVFLFIGSLLLLAGFILTPSLAAKFLSHDGIIQQATINRIRFSQDILKIGGACLIVIVSGVMILDKKFRESNKYSLLKYAVPYFLIFCIYMILRFLILQGLGGHYQSSHGTNLIAVFGYDSFARDIYALAGFLWPLDNRYVFYLYKLYAENTFVFYLAASIILIILLFILRKLFYSKSKLYLFIFLWIFITLLPVHNFILN